MITNSDGARARLVEAFQPKMEQPIADLKEERLQEMTMDTLNRLNSFALSRLRALRLPELFMEDLPQGSIEDVLAERRQPRREDLTDPDAFENYLRGIISSKAEAMSRRVRCEAMPEHDTIASTNSLCPSHSAHQADLKAVFFTLLRKKTALRDQPTVAKWEETFADTDRVPVIDGDRKSTWRVRRAARTVVRELKGRILWSRAAH